MCLDHFLGSGLQRRMRGVCAWGLTVVFVLAGSATCRRGGGSGEGSPPTIKDNAGLLFTFFDNRAQMRTVDRIKDVSEDSCKAVMVTTLRGGLPDDRIYVTDLAKKDKNGNHPVWIEKRGHWLDRTMPRRSVAKLAPPPPKRRRKRRRRRAAATQTRKAQSAGSTGATSGAGAAPAAGDQQEMPKVVMFSTTWCPSCKTAKAFFTQKGVRFVELDVEKNQAAAQKMVEIQQAQGLKVGAVPLIVIGNRIYQGFSQMQIESALAQLPNA